MLQEQHDSMADIEAVVEHYERKRRHQAGEFLIRTKNHLNHLARAGLDTRIVRELVLVHTLAVMCCDRVDSDKWIEDINCQSFWDSLGLPTTADEAALIAEREAAAGGTRRAADAGGRDLYRAFSKWWDAHGEDIEQAIGCPPKTDGLHRALDRMADTEKNALYDTGYRDALEDTEHARLVTVAREVVAYERPLEDLADVLADMGEDTTPEGGSV